MPILKDFRLKKTLSIPSIPEGEVEIYDSVLVKDMMGAEFKNEGGEYSIENALRLLPLLIVDWNLTDEKGNKQPINVETLGLLTANDLMYLLGEITNFASENKKK